MLLHFKKYGGHDMLLNFINLLFILFLVIRHKKIILKYLKKILNIRIIACGLFIYFILVFLIGACPLYR